MSKKISHGSLVLLMTILGVNKEQVYINTEEEL